MVLDERIRMRNVRVVLGVFSALWMSPCIGDKSAIKAFKHVALKRASIQPAGKTEKICVPQNEIPLSFPSPRREIQLSNLDSLALFLSSKIPNTAIVNAANAENPGGGVRTNGFVQEEVLCTMTNLLPSLESGKKKFYPLRGRGQRGFLWTRNVSPIIRVPKLDSKKFLSEQVVNQYRKNPSSVFLTPGSMQSKSRFSVFSMAAPRRKKIKKLNQKRLFWDMFHLYKGCFEMFHTHSLQHHNKNGLLILTIPGSGDFAHRSDGSVDHRYLDLNVCALSAAFLSVNPCFFTIIPRSEIDGRNLGQEVVRYVKNQRLLVSKLRTYQISSSLNQASASRDGSGCLLGSSPLQLLRIRLRR